MHILTLSCITAMTIYPRFTSTVCRVETKVQVCYVGIPDNSDLDDRSKVGHDGTNNTACDSKTASYIRFKKGKL